MYGYSNANLLAKSIQFTTGIPEHKSRGIPPAYSWINSVYGTNKEYIPDSTPVKPFWTSTYEDSSLMHCLVIGHSIFCITILANQTCPMILEETECCGDS
jgi:hypothetical protein